MIQLLLFFALLSAPPIAQPPNTVPVGAAITLCQEPSCIITAVSSPTAQLYFGVGTTWCATPMTLKLPLTINYSSPNLALCATDPHQGVVKGVVAQEQLAAYTITYSISGVVQPVVTIPALPPTVTSTLTCAGGTVTIINYSNNTWAISGSGSCTTVLPSLKPSAQ
jgi:hypothetical protein